jgi:hypothetical protein
MPRADVIQLIEAAASVNTFAKDWGGREAWLAARLRDENGCRQALFEVRIGLYFRALGQRLKYLSPQQRRGPYRASCRSSEVELHDSLTERMSWTPWNFGRSKADC